MLLAIGLPDLLVQADHVGHLGHDSRVAVEYAGITEIGLTTEEVEFDVARDLHRSVGRRTILGLDAVKRANHVGRHGDATRRAVVAHRNHCTHVIARVLFADSALELGRTPEDAVIQLTVELMELGLDVLSWQHFLQLDMAVVKRDVVHHGLRSSIMKGRTLDQLPRSRVVATGFERFHE